MFLNFFLNISSIYLWLDFLKKKKKKFNLIFKSTMKAITNDIVLKITKFKYFCSLLPQKKKKKKKKKKRKTRSIRICTLKCTFDLF